jgi:type I restriction enzyme S subunit
MILHDAWDSGILSDLCSLRKETCNPIDCNLDIYVGLEHIESGKFFLKRHGLPKEVKSTKNRFYAGDVIYGKLRPYLDKAVVSESKGICSTDILVFMPKANVPPSFLAGILHCDKFIQHAVNTTHGVNHPRTSWKSLKDYEIKIPPLKEQQKIAAILFKIQQAIEVQESIVEAAQELKKSTMQHVFTYGLRGEKTKETEIGRVPESWEMQPLGSILTLNQYGLSVRGSTKGRYPMLRMNCQIDGKVIFDNLQYVELDKKTFEKFKLKDGDILFNRTNSWELVGRTAIFHSDEEAVFASYLIRLRINPEKVNPDFINYFFNMDSTQQKLKTLASRGVSQSNISASKLKTFYVSIAKLNEQIEIVKILQIIDSNIEYRISKKIALKDLFKTALNKLMTGKIRVKDSDIDTSCVLEMKNRG